MSPPDTPAKSNQSDARRTLAGLLIRARKDADLTQLQLAKKLRCPQSFISKIESGKRRINIVQFIEVCRVLEIDPYMLMKQIEGMLEHR